MTDTAEWVPEAKPVPLELTPDFEHATFTPDPTQTEVMSGVPLMDRLDDVMKNRLHEMFGMTR